MKAIYDAAGLRVEQSVGGSVTTYTWDTALPLAQVLATSDGALDLYLSTLLRTGGVGRVGEERSRAWAYLLQVGEYIIQRERNTQCLKTASIWYWPS